MIGPIIALSCAISWAIAVVFWRKGGQGVHAFALNVFKNGFALALLVPTLYFVEGQFSLEISSRDFWLLTLSGVIGIGISDALYLWSLNLIGASRLAIIDCVYAPSIMVLAWFFLDEKLSSLQILGALLVLSAVFLITHEKSVSGLSKRDIVRGSVVCTIAIIAMAGGILMVKPVFERVNLFGVILIRLAAGFLAAFAITLLLREPVSVYRSLWDSKYKGRIVAASFFGTYISMVFWVAGFKYNKAAVAAILNQTTTFFTVISAALFLNEPLTQRKILATLIAFAGVVLITIF